MENENTDVLLLAPQFAPILVEEDCRAVKSIMREFMECYVENKDKPVEEWLGQKMQEQLQDRDPEEIQAMAKEIVTTIEVDEANIISLAKAIGNGRSKESWFASAVLKGTSAMSAQEAGKYLTELDNALQTANESLYRTITTQAGAINQNPRLDGFIAEQYHAQTFNLNAEATGSSYRAKVLEANGNAYTKNSVDIVIMDGNGKVVRRYQSKYCKDAKATERAFEQGNYRGQQKLVAKGQEANIQKKSTTVIEAPDGTMSNPLSKSTAEQMRDEAQSGNWGELNWNEYKIKNLAIGIGKQAGYAALQGAAIGVGFDIAQKLWTGEKINGEEVVETALVSGADFGIKAAVAGAIKVGVEKEVIKGISIGTPAGTISNIAFIAVEGAKVVGKMMTGGLSVKEGIEKIEQTTIATTAGLVLMGEGSTIGIIAGMLFGPVGSAIGAFVGGTVAYMAGAKVGETVVKGAQKIRDGAIKVAKTIGLGISSAVGTLANGVKSLFSSLVSFF